MSEQEIKELKEQLKREIIAEMNVKKENQNVWQKIKEEYKEEFEKFDFTEHWEFINVNNQLIQKDDKILAAYPLQNAIGTLLRIANKSKTVAKMTITYEEAKCIVDKVLQVMKDCRERNGENG